MEQNQIQTIVCQNPKCNRTTVKTNIRQKYCSSRCSNRGNSYLVYHNKVMNNEELMERKRQNSKNWYLKNREYHLDKIKLRNQINADKNKSKG